ncbi:MAG: isoprenylcysteine carboxylmethyltransferase family protein [Deltaproteobacteria bacterium]|nr:isoprenylcysteine carboxylmethyltransferase family protein [Deltaproteobacteria bacterium]
MNIIEKIGKGIVYIITAFVILEPLWMLTPFVGFLYGSVLNVDFLESSKTSSWLLLFVFPPRRFMLIGLFLVTIGITFFFICAYNIYMAKLFKKGLVTTGIYRYLRHPQYISLIVPGFGFVILWGRFISYLSLFIMIYLYYMLAKKEESLCLLMHGKAYEQYRKRTIGIIPGVDFFEKIIRKKPLFALPKAIAILSGFLLVMCVALASGFTILKAREAFSDRLPIIQKEITVDGKKLSVIIPRIPILEKDQGIRLAFWKRYISPEKLFKSIKSSKRIKNSLESFFEMGMDTIFIIFKPRVSIIEEKGNTFVNFFMVPMDTRTGFTWNGAKGFRKNCEIKGLLKVERMLLANDTEPIKGNIDVSLVKDFKQDKKILTSIETKIDVILSRFY